MTLAKTMSPLRRADLRTEVAQSEIRGIATRGADAHGPFMLWDISDRGVRIWAAERIARNEIVKLTIAKPFLLVLSCEVKWCKAINDDGGGFQIGLRVLDNLQRLEALHRAVAKLDVDVTFSAELQPQSP